MGVGKTTIGRKLAKSLKLPFIDTDAVIVRSHGPIDEIFSSIGEQGFRHIENLVLKDALQSERSVIATGGGVVTNPENLELLRSASVFYLATDGRHIGGRLRHGNRPLIRNGMTDWNRIYESRKPLYEGAANFVVETSGVPLNKTVLEIKEKLGLQ